jgi:AraC-like DNA-binding protein
VRDYRCHGRLDDVRTSIPDDAQLCLVRTGVFGYQAEGREHVVDANSVLLIRPGVEYRTRHPGDDTDTSTLFNLPDATLRAITGTPEDGPPPEVPWTVRTVGAETFRDHWTLLREMSEDAGDPDRVLAIEEHALRVATDLLNAPALAGPSGRVLRAATEQVHRDLTESVKELIALRLSERLPLTEVAAEVGWSPFELTRVFRRHTGFPIHRYRRQLRLRTAYSRLAEGETHIGNLALDLGFSTHSHFAEAFRSEFGLSPSDLRDEGGGTPPGASAGWATFT